MCNFTGRACGSRAGTGTGRSPSSTSTSLPSRSHMIWLIRKSPVVRGQQDGKDVDIKGIFDGIDTSSLADVKSAIEKKDSLLFAAAYKTMLESCYSCHKSVGRPYLKPMIPRTPVQSVMNVDPNATWPQ